MGLMGSSDWHSCIFYRKCDIYECLLSTKATLQCVFHVFENFFKNAYLCDYCSGFDGDLPKHLEWRLVDTYHKCGYVYGYLWNTNGFLGI